MELIAFGSMILLVLYLVATHNGNLGIILPILSVYALAGFKLLPALQQIYSSAATIKGSISAFESIRDDLLNSFDQESGISAQENLHLPLKHEIRLDNISFAYPNKTTPAINKLDVYTCQQPSSGRPIRSREVNSSRCNPWLDNASNWKTCC